MTPVTDAKDTQITVTSSDLLRGEDAARLLGVHFTTLYRWIKNGRIVAVKFGKIHFIPVSEVERLKHGS